MIFPLLFLFLLVLSLVSVSPSHSTGKDDYVVPNIVHQTYDYQSPNFFFFLSVLCVQRFLRPDKHILWVNDEGRFRRAHWESWQRRAEPSSWESVLAEMLRNGSVEARLMLFPLHPPDNSSVFASNKAHRSDLMRMQALFEQGGVYLDTDAFALPQRPLHDLRVHDFVLSFDNLVSPDRLAPKRMNNGVLLSSPRSPFLRLWREAYSSSFNPSSFDHDSSVVPFRLATDYPDLVHVEWNRLAPVSYGFQTSLLADALTCGLWQPSPPAIWYPRLSKIGKEVVYNFSESAPDEYMYQTLTKKSVLHLTMSQVRGICMMRKSLGGPQDLEKMPSFLGHLFRLAFFGTDSFDYDRLLKAKEDSARVQAYQACRNHLGMYTPQEGYGRPSNGAVPPSERQQYQRPG